MSKQVSNRLPKTIRTRRTLLGEPRDMQIFASELLEIPGSLRERAMRAVFKGHPDPESQQSLCNDLSSELYKDELYELALDLDLPVTKKTTKKQLCEMLSLILTEAESTRTIPEYSELKIAEEYLKKYLKNFPSLTTRKPFPHDLSNLSDKERIDIIYVSLLYRIYYEMTTHFRDNNFKPLNREELLDFLNRKDIRDILSKMVADLMLWIHGDESAPYKMRDPSRIYESEYREFVNDATELQDKIAAIRETRPYVEDHYPVEEFDLSE